MKKHVIAAPRFLSLFAPVAALVKDYHSNTEGTSMPSRGRSLRMKAERKNAETKKSVFAKAISLSVRSNCTPDPKNIAPAGRSRNREDFTSTTMEEIEEKKTADKKTLPTFKINSNNLRSLKKQNPTLKKANRTLAINEGIKKMNTISKAPEFYIPPIEPVEETIEDELEEAKETAQFTVYCRCGNACERNALLCRKCIEDMKAVEFSGYLYVKDQEALKQCWVMLLNRELCCICLVE
eukprot:TRINITY_DN1716_c0_g1_i6.p1 TRINITY_DN1716_c0_g1~~TRINITY_DN1716_c0_g1_i6.p1  ORF type:complete len:238 (+),score=54.71 TRINITY_DN1716_c0_g1_i6:1124-1837(+)